MSDKGFEHLRKERNEDNNKCMKGDDCNYDMTHNLRYQELFAFESIDMRF